MTESRLERIRVLQCLSTFYVKDFFTRSTLAFRMIGDYTGLSPPGVARVMRALAQKGLVALSANADAGRLDPSTWRKTGRGSYFAHFVANAPEALRDENSLRAVADGCCRVRRPEYYAGCSTTVATAFNGVFAAYGERADSAPEPQERLFVPRPQVDERETAMPNLWFLASALTPSLLFLRELLVLYTTGYGGSSGADIAERGRLALLLLNDEALEEEQSEDLIAHERCDEVGCRVYETLGGARFKLELDGTARFDGYVRRYVDRGACLRAVQLIEMSARTESSCCSSPRGRADSRAPELPELLPRSTPGAPCSETSEASCEDANWLISFGLEMPSVHD
jgi:hypothetical protein